MKNRRAVSDISTNFIIGMILIFIVIAVIAIWLLGDSGIKVKLVDYIRTNLFPK